MTAFFTPSTPTPIPAASPSTYKNNNIATTTTTTKTIIATTTQPNATPTMSATASPAVHTTSEKTRIDREPSKKPRSDRIISSSEAGHTPACARFATAVVSPITPHLSFLHPREIDEL